MFAKDIYKTGALVAEQVITAGTNMFGKQTLLPMQLTNMEFYPSLNKKTIY